MKLWYVSPVRKREVWYLKTKIFGFIPKTIKRVVYWDVNAETGISWLLKYDRKTSPDFISLHGLISKGWIRETN